jgi:hypothetical protein
MIIQASDLSAEAAAHYLYIYTAENSGFGVLS